jgi:TnpA family transposase
MHNALAYRPAPYCRLITPATVISIYTHISDQYSVFSTIVISCALREATYVLDGLLSNNTNINPEFHCTDTHGYTDHLFALCYLLGISFQPRLSDLPHQALYKMNKNDKYDFLEDFFTISGLTASFSPIPALNEAFL